MSSNLLNRKNPAAAIRASVVVGALLGITGVAAADIVPTDGMIITTDTTFAPGAYHLPNGITIAASNVTIEGNGTTLYGNDIGNGLHASSCNSVTVRNLTITDYFHGMHFHGCDDLTVENCNVWETPELPEGDIFLNIFDGPNGSYAHAMWFRYCDRAVIRQNDVSDQQNGISLFNCDDALVDENYASYNTGWGIYFYDTDNSTVQDNTADYCTRLYGGWSGADAASFLIVYGSDNNQVIGNSFVGGGDGVFLAGATHWLAKKPNNNNYFAYNDCSDSPNNGFEGTFSGGNVFEYNISDGCNYGYWLGYAYNNEVRHNQANNCHTAGIAIEHGRNHIIENNTLSGNGRGIWLWTDPDEGLVAVYTEARDSYGYTIRNNTISGNAYGILCEATGNNRFSYDYTIYANEIRDNAIGIRFKRSNDSTIYGNWLTGNTSRGLELDASTGLLLYNNWLDNNQNALDNRVNVWHTTRSAGPNIIGGPVIAGNHWANYNGADTDYDGLGDTQLPHPGEPDVAGGGDVEPLIAIDDSDADGLPDPWEQYWFQSLAYGAGDDAEPDGLSNIDELLHETSPVESDTDADGLDDGDEIHQYGSDPNNADSDNDGLLDGEEVHVYTSDPMDTDTDDDGLSDGDEVQAGTLLHDPDTDDDTMPDGWEVENDLDPLVDDSNEDPDNDGFSNAAEHEGRSDPNKPWSIPTAEWAGNALHFDGVDDVVHVGPVPFGGDPIAVEAWVHPDRIVNPGELMRIVYRADSLQISLVQGNTIGCAATEGPTTLALNGSQVLPPNEWTHVAFVQDGIRRYLYINGELDASLPGSADIGHVDNPVVLGNRSETDDDGFDGRLDEIRLWTVDRTQADINTCMHGGLIGNEVGLAAYWNFNEGDGQTVFDATPGGYDGRLGATPDPDDQDPAWVESLIGPGSLSLGPEHAAVTHHPFVPHTAPLTVTATISDQARGDRGVDEATLLFDYGWPYNAFSAEGVGPGGDGDGLWTFTIPPRGSANAGKTLFFYLRSVDGDGNIGFATNDENLYTVAVIPLGDGDDNGITDLADYPGFADCLSGPLGVALEEPCRVYDANADGDVDLMDYRAFAEWMVVSP